MIKTKNGSIWNRFSFIWIKEIKRVKLFFQLHQGQLL